MFRVSRAKNGMYAIETDAVVSELTFDNGEHLTFLEFISESELIELRQAIISAQFEAIKKDGKLEVES